MTTAHTSAWHSARKNGIGASEVAALFGFARFGKTAATVWASKQPSYQPQPYEEHQLMGFWLEPALLKLFTHRTGIGCTGNSTSRQHIAAAWLFATPDGYTDTGAPIDCKTANNYQEWGDDGTDDIPTDYLIQMQTQIACAGASEGWLVVFLSLLDKRIYRIPANATMQAEIVTVTGKQWADWQAGKAPAPVCPNDCRLLWPMLTEQTLNIDSTAEDATTQTLLDAVYQIDALEDDTRALKGQRDGISAEIKTITAKLDALKAAIGTYMGGSKLLLIDGLQAYRRMQRKGMGIPTIQRVRSKDAYNSQG